VPILHEYSPELLIVASGVDANLFDPMARLSVTAGGFAGIGRRLREVAVSCCEGRVVSVQEGGYSPVYSPFCWLTFFEALAGQQPHEDPWELFVAGQAGCRDLETWQVERNDATRRALAAGWSSLR
jgi:acetoin utilization deacetylase AcuC-like enzyme